ncbi:MAG: hybrid sensor histidine kinase/response regulator [Gammaproteobacteria bacterium]
MSHEDDDGELLAMFVQESREHLEVIEPNLLVLEQDGDATDPEIVNLLFRAVHSIKGASSFFGLHAIAQLSHTMENLLGKVRDGELAPSSAITDSLLAGLDKLSTMVMDPEHSESVDAAVEVSVIEVLLSPSGDETAHPTATPDPTVDSVTLQTLAAPAPGLPRSLDPECHMEAVAEARAHGRRLYHLRLPLDQAEEARAVLDALASVGTLVCSRPELDEARWQGHDPLPSEGELELLYSTVLDEAMLATAVAHDGVQIEERGLPTTASGADATDAEVAVSEVQSENPSTTNEGPDPVSRPGFPERTTEPEIVPAVSPARTPTRDPGRETAKAPVDETLRVSVALLDELINNAGELVLVRNQLLRAAASPGQSTAQVLPPVQSLVQSLDAITSRIQAKVMQARMQPVSVVFNRYPRVIRDLSRKLDKRIELELRGGDVELDKSIIENIADPLTHLIRNVADHGIETPADRLAAGKPEVGRAVLEAAHQSGMVNIELSDDGAGMDVERLKAKALEKGLISEEQARSMSDEDALMLIFAPGFSTAAAVSDVSGRGVGMDVVRTNIEKLGGSVQVESSPGEGTRFTLKLPLTLAIIPAMIVSTAGQRFAIPEVGLVEIVSINESERSQRIERVGDAPVLRLRETLLPLVDLADVLGLQRQYPPGSGVPDRRTNLVDRRARTLDENGLPVGTVDDREIDQRVADRRRGDALVAYVMVLRVGKQEFGMVVDDVLDSEEIVVKPLPSYFKDSTCLSATTILGDGGVALIIDIAGVVETINLNNAAVDRAARVDLDEDRRAALREKQNLIVLRTFAGGLMGITHGMIRRVEKIPAHTLETLGGRLYVRYRGKTIRAIVPEQLAGAGGDDAFAQGALTAGEHGDELYMLVPQSEHGQIGLLFDDIVDSLEMDIDLDVSTIQGCGLIGSTQVKDRVVLLGDVASIIDAAHPDPAQTDPGELVGLKALVVDDTPYLRAVTAKYLADSGLEVDQAVDGEQALHMLGETAYDLLITDLDMPAMDGFALLAALASTRNPHVPAIASGSAISASLEARCRQAGFQACVPTVDRTRLLAAVRSIQTRRAA